eukprot:SM000008S22374  [mRNA]  locus=s8:1434092:1437602:+ [translate_table: standard]
MGMGFNDFEEARAGLPPRPGLGGAAAVAAAEDDERAAVGAAAAAAKDAAAAVNGEKLWKRGKAERRRRREYKTAAQLLEERHALEGGGAGGLAATQTILDMRGPQVKVLTNLEHMGPGPGGFAGSGAVEDDTPMPELQHNLRLVVDLAEAEIAGADRRLRHELDSVAVLQRERERLQADELLQRKQVPTTRHGRRHLLGRWPRPSSLVLAPLMTSAPGDVLLQVEVLEGIVSTLDGLQALATAAAPLPQLDALADALGALQRAHPEEFRLYNLASVGLAAVLPLFQLLFRGWDPLAMPSHGAGQTLLGSADTPRDFAIFTDMEGDDRSKLRIMGVSRWRQLVAHCAVQPVVVGLQLVREVVLPPLRTAVTNRWEPRDPEPLLQFLEAWDVLLPTAVRRNVLEQLVLPKLGAAVDAWDPRLETIPIHAWLHPWLPHLGARLEPLYAPIRYKLGAALAAWHPSDDSARVLLAPWRGVFDAASWDQLLGRCVVPQLTYELQQLVVNPQHQQLDQFNWVIKWVGLVSTPHMVAMMEAAFFPKWHAVLHAWLGGPAPNFGEITRWYEGWKSLFPPELQAHERVRQQLLGALDAMNRAVEGAPLPQPGAAALVGHLRDTEEQHFELKQQETQFADNADVPSKWSRSERAFALRQQQQQQLGSGPARASSLAGGGRVSGETGAALNEASLDMSLKDVVEAFAQQHDVQFLPKPGRTHEGLPAYGFGAVSVVVDTKRQELLALANGRWQPVALEQLLEMHRSRGGRWQQ